MTDPGTPATPGGVVNPGERLIIISGHPNNLNMAVGMLHTVSSNVAASFTKIAETDLGGLFYTASRAGKAEEDGEQWRLLRVVSCDA